MKLEKAEYKERTNEHGDLYKKTTYKLGDHYLVIEAHIDYHSGNTFDQLTVIDDGRYTPPIYYYEPGIIGGDEAPRFEIHTCSYGSLSPEEIEKVIAGYQEAIQAVEALTEAFCI